MESVINKVNIHKGQHKVQSQIYLYFHVVKIRNHKLGFYRFLLIFTLLWELHSASTAAPYLPVRVT
jgi:hypothetical protein